MVKQRDDAQAELERGRSTLSHQAAEMELHRTQFTKAEEELRARTELEAARLRRERYQMARQRDDFRARIGELAEQQRRLLDEMSAQTSRPLGETNVPVDFEPVPIEKVPVRDARESRKALPAAGSREPVIDIIEAEIYPHGDESGIPLPRIRSVPVPPTQVHTL